VSLPAESSKHVPPRRRWRRWALAALLLLAFLGLYALGRQYDVWGLVRANVEMLRGQVEQHFGLAVLLFFLAYVVVTALSIPSAAALSLTAGALFGRTWGIAVVALAATCGATLAMLSGRYLLRDWVRRRLGDRLQTLDRGIERDGAYYLFTLRLIPVIPFFLINLGMGLTSLRVRTFFWVSLVGMLPGAILYVNTGAALGTVRSPGDVFSPGVLVSFALLGLVPLLLRKLITRKTQ
jgi:uncharacterized membrane protein YdjX (TVP38/TMEM64 family)